MRTREVNLGFFRGSDVLTQGWFEKLDQFILKSLSNDLVIADLNSGFQSQPGLVAYWNFVLSELIYLRNELDQELKRTESSLVQKVLGKSNVNLTYRILDLISNSDTEYCRKRSQLNQLERVIKKVEGVLDALDHRRSTLNYFARVNFPSKNSI